MELIIIIASCLCLMAVFLFLHHRSRKEGVEPVEEQAISTYQEPLGGMESMENLEIPEYPEIPESPESDTHSADTDKDNEKSMIQNKQLVAGLHKVLEEDKVFLRPDIHIDDVAKMLLTNRTYVTRMMRQEYGLTFIEYVNVARIQYSQKLLYSSDMTLDEVAEKSGFQSTSNYCRAFKRYIGTSPMGWLQKMK